MSERRAEPSPWSRGDDPRIIGGVVVGRAVWRVPSNPPSEYHGLVLHLADGARFKACEQEAYRAVFFDKSGGVFMTLALTEWPPR